MASSAKRILSVSYASALLMRREFFLKNAGYEVISALGIAEAQFLCRTSSFDLVILGHSIPRADKQLLAHLSHEACSAPVLALVRPREEPFDGADAVIEATASEDALLDTVRRLLTVDTVSDDIIFSTWCPYCKEMRRVKSNRDSLRNSLNSGGEIKSHGLPPCEHSWKIGPRERERIRKMLTNGPF